MAGVTLPVDQYYVSSSSSVATVGTLVPAGVKTIKITTDANHEYDDGLFLSGDNILPENFTVPGASFAGLNTYDTTVAGCNVDEFITQIEFVQTLGELYSVDVLITHDSFIYTEIGMQRRIDIDLKEVFEENDCADFTFQWSTITNPTTSTSEDGALTATGSGGSSDYTWTVYNEDGTQMNPFTLPIGIYTVTVVDNIYGCEESQEIELVPSGEDIVISDDKRHFCVDIVQDGFETLETDIYGNPTLVEFLGDDNICHVGNYPNDEFLGNDLGTQHAITSQAAYGPQNGASHYRIAGEVNSETQTGNDVNGQAQVLMFTKKYDFEKDGTPPAYVSMTGANPNVTILRNGMGGVYDYATPEAFSWKIVNVQTAAGPDQCKYFEVEFYYTAQSDSYLPTNLDPDPFTSAVTGTFDGTGMEGMCTLGHEINIRLGATGYQNVATSQVQQPVITTFIDRTGKLPQFNQNAKPYWKEDTESNQATNAKVIDEFIFDSDGFLVEANKEHYLGNRVRKKADSRIYEIAGTPGVRYKLNVEADRGNTGLKDKIYYNHETSIWSRTYKEKIFTIPNSGFFTHVINFETYSATMTSTYSDREINIYIEPVLK